MFATTSATSETHYFIFVGRHNYKRTCRPDKTIKCEFVLSTVIAYSEKSRTWPTLTMNLNSKMQQLLNGSVATGGYIGIYTPKIRPSKLFME